MSDDTHEGSNSGLNLILESAKNQLEQMIDLHPQGMLLLDKARKVARCNDSLIRILGLSGYADALGKSLEELFESCPQDGGDLFDENTISSRVKVRYQCSLPGDDERQLDVTRISAGDLSAPAVLLVEDVTDKLLEQEEENMQSRIQAAEAVTGALMHELNQPLAVVTIQAHMLIHDLERGLVDVERLKTGLEEIAGMTKDAADRLRNAQSFRTFVTKPYIKGQEIVDLDKST